MNGKLGMNMNMSEFVSLILEPVANEEKKNMETNATDGLIADIEGVNKVWKTILEEDHAPSSDEENTPERWKADN